MATTQDTNRAKDQARAQLESIKEMVERLNSRHAREQEVAREEIQEDALSVEVRSGWHTPGAEHEDTEYCILLCTGGPAVRIIGDLGRYNEPETATLEYQDWFTPWEKYRDTTSEDDAALLDYARTFYYGD